MNGLSAPAFNYSFRVIAATKRSRAKLWLFQFTRTVVNIQQLDYELEISIA